MDEARRFPFRERAGRLVRSLILAAASAVWLLFGAAASRVASRARAIVLRVAIRFDLRIGKPGEVRMREGGTYIFFARLYRDIVSNLLNPPHLRVSRPFLPLYCLCCCSSSCPRRSRRQPGSRRTPRIPRGRYPSSRGSLRKANRCVRAGMLSATRTATLSSTAPSLWA